MKTQDFIEIIEKMIQKKINVPFSLGRIDSQYVSGNPRVLFDGENRVSIKRYPYLSSYEPIGNDRILLANIAGTHIVIGHIGAFRGGGSSGGGGTGIGLNFTWNGTSLGIKREDQTVYSFIDLQGPAGKEGLRGETGDTGATGSQGPQGAIGPIGLQGATGAKGATGSQGPKGDTGLQGIQGPIGVTGAEGPQGLKGDTGAKGATGSIGLTGPKGDTGLRGPEGPQGAIGPEGPQGLRGLTGNTGPKGDTGSQGIQGATGPIGLQGPQGLKGDTGSQGPKGDTGNTGATGAIGPQGLKGDTGPKGDTGATGPSGDLTFLPRETAWVALPMGASWVNFGSPFQVAQYKRDLTNFVNLRGLIKNGAVGTLVTLPAGFRPKATEVFYLGDASSSGQNVTYKDITNQGLTKIEVKNTGVVSIISIGSNASVTLSGVRFSIE